MSITQAATGIQGPTESRPAGELFADQNADILLRSCDNVDFRTHKRLLVKLLHGSEDMLGAPVMVSGDAQPVCDGLPVAKLSEPAQVLRPLLHLLYPIPFPDLTGDWPTLLALCMALDKYVAKFFPFVVIQALTRVIKLEHGPGPEAVYVLACRHTSCVALPRAWRSSYSAHRHAWTPFPPPYSSVYQQRSTMPFSTTKVLVAVPPSMPQESRASSHGSSFPICQNHTQGV